MALTMNWKALAAKAKANDGAKIPEIRGEVSFSKDGEIVNVSMRSQDFVDAFYTTDPVNGNLIPRRYTDSKGVVRDARGFKLYALGTCPDGSQIVISTASPKAVLSCVVSEAVTPQAASAAK